MNQIKVVARHRWHILYWRASALRPFDIGKLAENLLVFLRAAAFEFRLDVIYPHWGTYQFITLSAILRLPKPGFVGYHL